MRTLLVILCALICASVSAQQAATNNSAVGFQAVAVFVDSKDVVLAAYQLELTVTSGNAKIVGIEGGEHPAFAEAPFYDPMAIQHERVILAAFSTQAADKLPKGKTRVATIHLQVSGQSEVKLEIKLQTAADTSGQQIVAEGSTMKQTTK